MQCFLCGWELEMEIPAIQMGEIQFFEVPDRYCAKCKMILHQIINRVAEKENGKKES